jgi:hypothetical protein
MRLKKGSMPTPPSPNISSEACYCAVCTISIFWKIKMTSKSVQS